jgi:hypothetical protein
MVLLLFSYRCTKVDLDLERPRTTEKRRNSIRASCRIGYSVVVAAFGVSTVMLMDTFALNVPIAARICAAVKDRWMLEFGEDKIWVYK